MMICFIYLHNFVSRYVRFMSAFLYFIFLEGLKIEIYLVTSKQNYFSISLLLACLWHILHGIALICLCFLHFFHVYVFHHLAHDEGDSNHNDEGVLKVSHRVEGRFDFKVTISTAGVELQRVHQAVVSCLCHASQESFGVLALSKLFFINLDNDWFKGVIAVLDLYFIHARAGHCYIKVTLTVDHAHVLAMLH